MKWLGFNIWRMDFYFEFKTGALTTKLNYDCSLGDGSLCLTLGRLYLSASLTP